ncbi:hypothetical protein ACFQ4O_14045, partial [Methylopila musalis]
RSDRPRDDRRERGGQTAPFASSGPKRPERGPDPDSPFAKLLALKAQLETGGRSKGPDGGDA